MDQPNHYRLRAIHEIGVGSFLTGMVVLPGRLPWPNGLAAMGTVMVRASAMVTRIGK